MMASFAGAGFTVSAILCGDAPVSVASPGSLLALFAAVLSPSTAATFRELTSVFFPLAALPEGTLSDPTTAVVFPAQVAHNDASPVLHVALLGRHGVGMPRRRGLRGEFFDQREDVVRDFARLFDKLVVPFIIQLFLRGRGIQYWVVLRVKHFQLVADLESRHQSGLLEV